MMKASKRKIGIFRAGCPVCEAAVNRVKGAACPPLTQVGGMGTIHLLWAIARLTVHCPTPFPIPHWRTSTGSPTPWCTHSMYLAAILVNASPRNGNTPDFLLDNHR